MRGVGDLQGRLRIANAVGGNASFDFRGRVLLVTGAASGIGRAIAAYFRACGARVMLGDINAEAAHALDPHGDTARALRYDAAQAQDAQALVNACMAHFAPARFCRAGCSCV